MCAWQKGVWGRGLKWQPPLCDLTCQQRLCGLESVRAAAVVGRESGRFVVSYQLVCYHCHSARQAWEAGGGGGEVKSDASRPGADPGQWLQPPRHTSTDTGPGFSSFPDPGCQHERALWLATTASQSTRANCAQRHWVKLKLDTPKLFPVL